jgi:hypothetical protein
LFGGKQAFEVGIPRIVGRLAREQFLDEVFEFVLEFAVTEDGADTWGAGSIAAPLASIDKPSACAPAFSAGAGDVGVGEGFGLPLGI